MSYAGLVKYEKRWRPASTEELITKLLELEDVYFWRGSADASWNLDSTIVRRIRQRESKFLNTANERSIVRAETSLLKRARHEGYGIRDGVRLSDLELLALLRHLGAATRLLDFSRSALVALWFACNTGPDVDGELLGINSGQVMGGPEGQDLEVEADQYEDVMAELGQTSDVWHWQPTRVSPRVAAQHSHFLLSTFVDEEHGTTAIGDVKDSAQIVIDVPAVLKPALLELLAGLFDIRQLSMFPDVEGFANAFGVFSGDHDRW